MKKYTLLFILLFILQWINAQEDGGDSNQFDYEGELARVLNVPNSPEAEAFAKYGNTEVSLYTGTPNIAVPLYNHIGRELNLPIAINYDASGIRVEQKASQVGLSWSLSFGGRISRIVNGLPDDYLLSGVNYNTINQTNTRQQINNYIENNVTFNSEQEMRNYFYFLKDINNNLVDVEPDYYSLNVMGLNEVIVFDMETFQPKSLNNPRTKIEAIFNDLNASRPYITGWVVISENGTKYYFLSSEKTYLEGDSQGSEFLREYISSWVLTKIESPNKKDIYEFNYTHTGYWQESSPTSRISHVTNTISTELPSYVSLPTNETLNSSFYKLNQVYLSNIIHNEIIVFKTEMSTRYDINSTVKKIDNIKIYRPCYETPEECNIGSELFKSIDFSYTYFGMDEDDDPSLELSSDIRLKLDEVTIKNNNYQDYQKYKFDYSRPKELPPTNSFSQDYLGYYNGAGNTVLYPSYILDEGTPNQITFHGANRDPNEEFSTIGMLKRITYPTGGFTEFDFELHDITEPVESIDEVYIISETVGESTEVDTSLYSDENGNPCDDAHLDGAAYPYNYPRIKIGQFHIQEAGTYRLRFNGGNSRNTQAKIKYIPFNNCNEEPCTRPVEVNNYNSYCDFYQGPFVLNSRTESVDNYQFLQEGYYVYMVLTDEFDDGGWRTVNLKVSKDEATTTLNQIKKAGLRVASTTDYTKEDEVALVKSYRYKTEIYEDFSSAIEIFSPRFTYITRYEKYVPRFSDAFIEQTLHRNTTATGNSNQPHIVYSKVYEVKGNYRPETDITQSGYTEYSFYTGETGIVSSRRLPPFTNSFYGNYEVGKIKNTSVYNNESEELTDSQVSYYDTTILSQSGISLAYRDEFKYKYITSHYNEDTEEYSYYYQDACWQCISGGGGSQGQATNCNPQPHCPAVCVGGNATNTCFIDDLQYSPLSLYRYLTNGTTGNVLKMETREYFEGEDIYSVKDYVYSGEENYHLLKESKNIDSKLDEIKITYSYPSDRNESVYNNMVSNNRLTDVVVTQTYKNNILLSQKKREFSEGINAGFLVANIATAKENDNLDSRMKLNYDDSNNLIESEQVIDGVQNRKTAYIWGYDKTYLIAKLENVSYSDISPTTIELLENLSNADIDRTIGNNGSEGQLREALNDLRMSFSTALVVTYTYDPLIGVTSVTDAKGYTSYYEYDEFYRLKDEKDSQGNVISRNEYNYRTQN